MRAFRRARRLFVATPVRAPRTCLAGLALLLLLAGLELPSLRVSFSILPLVEANDEWRERVRRFDDEVPPEDWDLIAVAVFPEPIGREQLAALERAAERLESDPEIAEVFSVAEAPLPDPELGLAALRRPADLLGPGEDLRGIVARHPLLHRRLVSDDARSAVLLFRTDGDLFSDDDDAFVARLERVLPEVVEGEERVLLLGAKVARRSMRAAMKADTASTVLLQVAIFLVLLPLVFRSLRGMLLPVATVGCSLVLSGGLLAASGRGLGLIDLAVPGIVTMLAICDAVHMVHRFEEERARGAGRRRAARSMLHHVGAACLFTSATTAFGFLSLLVADHGAVREFALKAAAAVMTTFLVTVTLVPAALTLWPERPPAVPRLPGLGRIGRAGPRGVLVVCVLLLPLAFLGARRLAVDSRWLEEMPPSSEVVENLRWFEARFGGLMTFDVRITGPLHRPEVVRAVETLATELAATPGVNRAESYVDWLRAATGRPEGRLEDDEVARGLALLRLAGPLFPGHVLSRDLKVARLVLATDDDGTRRYDARRERLHELARDLPEGVEVQAAGFMLMAHESSRLLVETMLRSFLVSLAAISLLVAAIFRSLRIGLISVIPNLLPVLAALGLQGWLDMPLRIGLAMIYSLGLGLAVDDTIHLITRFRQERRGGAVSVDRALDRALAGSGVALVVTSAVLLIGSLCYLPAGFRSLRDVGLLLSGIVVTALLADLYVLPLLLRRFARR